MTLNLAVSRSRPSVQYGANFFFIILVFCVFFICSIGINLRNIDWVTVSIPVCVVNLLWMSVMLDLRH